MATDERKAERDSPPSTQIPLASRSGNRQTHRQSRERKVLITAKAKRATYKIERQTHRGKRKRDR
jgi:hypothetical protein